MQNRFGLLDMDVMPVFMIIALDIAITLRFSINCSAVICSPTVIFMLLREATSETYGPRVYFPSYLISQQQAISGAAFILLSLLCIFIIKRPKILSYHIYQISLS